MWVALAIFCALILFLKKRQKWFYILYKTLPRDFKAAIRFTKLNIHLWRWEKQQKTVPKVFCSLARKHPEKIAIYFEEEVWTFKQVDDLSNKIARYFKNEGIVKGETIALILDNRPEYVCIWLGLAKIGVVTALINTNLVNDPLLYSITVANSKAVIFGSEYAKALQGIIGKISDLKLYEWKSGIREEMLQDVVDLRNKLKDVDDSALTGDIEDGHPRDKIIYIYTSGTTGMPKPAVITNMRFIFLVVGVNYMMTLKPEDNIYDPLPLYHSAGGMVGVGQMILRSITITMRKKFSATNYWKDCQKYHCTVAQYIGEICRYLLVAHNNNKSQAIIHNVRAMFGNGLRPQIWSQFVETFGIKEMFEFYGATEGNSNLINIDSTPGAVGFVPGYAQHIYPISLIKCNEATGDPIRNSDGYCIRCKPHEPGVLIGKITPKKALNAFAGYADKKATQKKILQDVFKRGDCYFISGDILVQDELGYYFFKDRTGDTFRWKGENVATSEIEAVMSNLTNMNDVVVYGVTIPETEGRAGMAAIVDEADIINVDDLCKRLRSNLPSYAVPLFLRIMKSVPLTGTFKLKKVDLQKDGFNINNIKDDLYFYDAKASTYKKLTQEIYTDIMSGQIRL